MHNIYLCSKYNSFVHFLCSLHFPFTLIRETHGLTYSICNWPVATLLFCYFILCYIFSIRNLSLSLSLGMFIICHNNLLIWFRLRCRYMFHGRKLQFCHNIVASSISIQHQRALLVNHWCDQLNFYLHLNQ